MYIFRDHASQMPDLLSAAQTLSPAKNDKLLILVRHAESKLNATRREYRTQPLNFFKNGISHCIDPGVKDAPLTQEGQRQAQRAGRRLARDIISGYLPPIEVMGVSPLRRTLHTSRLLSDSADSEFGKISYRYKPARNEWWKGEDVSSGGSRAAAHLIRSPASCTTPSNLAGGGVRNLVIVPYLRERKTTSADQPCVRPTQAAEFWKNRPVHVHLLHPSDLPLGTTHCARHARASTPARLNHFFTIGLTKGCRKVKVESVDSVSRRIMLLEAWVKSRPEKVLMLVGHNMIFKAWQRYWQEHASGRDDDVQWVSREDAFSALTEETRRQSSKQRQDCCGNLETQDTGEGGSTAASTVASSADESEYLCGFERVMRQHNLNSGMKVYECPNTGCLIVRWRPSENPSPLRKSQSLVNSSLPAEKRWAY
eukprot:Gregarina_sp_Pseudo_9__4785@NODE_4_length_7126_cov_97_921970_g3_i0_p4_GENE_NODE_4_length_7126_cov_97_921970_g3_i0NODE_4_length_7126_cov_97_921970_g3_i0_p4_ORF_typecomplete_len425_score64_94His_Phos_1/PF00300_22/1_6e13His_Phos_1/PF00300_22/4_NODE_4_length_7126_cov_97_921970_g3_i043715645